MRVVVIVPVVVMGVTADLFDLGGRGAAMGGFAALDLELDGGVGDVELVPEGVLDAVEDVAAIAHGHLADEDVAGEGAFHMTD